MAGAGCRWWASMRNQRFLLGKLKLEFFAQEFSQEALDFFRFFFGSGKAKERVIGVSYVVEPSIVRIVGVHCGQVLRLFQKRFCPLEVTAFPAFPGSF